MNQQAADTPTILLIDDDAAVRLSFKAFLEDTGYRVIPAADGEQGIEHFHAGAPNLVIVDLRMPRMDGIEVLRYIRQAAPETPVIVVSGAGTLADSVQALRLGAWDYLIKPVPDLVVLQHAVDRVLEQARLREENGRYRRQLETLVLERTRELELRTEEAKRSAEQLRIFSLALEQSASSVIITDTRGRIEYVNRCFTELSGYSRSEVLGRNPRILRSNLTPADTYRDMWRSIRSGQTWRGELMNRKKTGEAYWEELTITPILNERGQVTHYLAIQEDISLRKAREASLIHQANHDDLTGLPNRLLAIDRLEQAVRRAARNGDRGALMFLDLDDFKQINDHHGHETGDQVLIEVSRRLRQAVRESDTVARIGGDEFLVILQWVKEIHVLDSLTQKIRDSLLPPMQLERTEISITASAGVALFPEEGADSGHLVRKADTAMYSAKQWGRNRVVFFHELQSADGP